MKKQSIIFNLKNRLNPKGFRRYNRGHNLCHIRNGQLRVCTKGIFKDIYIGKNPRRKVISGRVIDIDIKLNLDNGWFEFRLFGYGLDIGWVSKDRCLKCKDDECNHSFYDRVHMYSLLKCW